MLNWFKNLSFKKKINVGFTLTHVILGAVIVITLLIMGKASDKYQIAYEELSKPAALVSDASGVYSRILESLERGILLGETGDNTSALADVGAGLGELGGLLDRVEAAAAQSGFQAEYDELHAAYHDTNDELAAAYAAAFGQGMEQDVVLARSIYTSDSFTSKVKLVEEKFDKMFNTFVEAGDIRMQKTEKNVRLSTVVMAIILGVSILVNIFVITRTITLSLSVPIADLVKAAEKLELGDVDVEIKHYYNDEVGELADTLAKMLETTKAQAKIADRISQGDYCVDVVPKGEADLMGNAIANMIAQENRVMNGINQAVSEIRTGSGEVAAASQALAQGSTEQASAIQQITASINDINERTKVNAEDAQTANGLVVKAKNDAADSNSKMREMISAMADINESSENISKIIKVIDDIAFQTNILALNAAVEAARAGQHGRGFAVVADEVRNLAGKSAQAASETAELIQDTIDKVNKGSKLAEETAAALEAIVEIIEKIVTITNSIAVASNDQATAISQIDTAIGQVSQVVQTNSATSEECAAASEELSAQAGKLRDMISRYKLKEQAVSGYSREAVEPVGVPADLDEEAADDVPPVISLDDGFGKY